MSRFENKSGSNAIGKKQLQALTHSCEISVMQLYIFLREVHSSPPKRLNAECRKSPITDSIGDRYCYKVLCAMCPRQAPGNRVVDQADLSYYD